MCRQVMLAIGRGQHGSTYGGNPVAAKVALAALRVLVDEKLVDNSYRLGQLLRHELQAIQSRIITEVCEDSSVLCCCCLVMPCGEGCRRCLWPGLSLQCIDTSRCVLSANCQGHRRCWCQQHSAPHRMWNP